MTVLKVIKVAQRALDGTVVEYHVRLEYDPAKPFEVSAIFMPPNQAPTTWIFSREAMARACYGVKPPKAGMVQMYCCVPAQVFHVDLYGEYNGQPWKGEVHFPYDDVQAFLRDANTALPAQEMALPPGEVDELILAINDWSDNGEQ
jgi:hypothetical protein